MADRAWAVLQRDLRLAMRRPAEVLLPVLFFVLACTLFPLGVGPEPEMLRQIAPGLVWVCALLAALLSLPALYGPDHADGSLEQMLLAQPWPVALALVKSLAHWLTTLLPLIVAAPVLALLLGMAAASTGVLLLTLLLGTPVLSLLGSVGAALTLGLRQGPALVLLLVLPLCVPVLVFGAGAVSSQAMGLDPRGHLYLLGALLLLSVLGAPLATAAALRISV